MKFLMKQILTCILIFSFSFCAYAQNGAQQDTLAKAVAVEPAADWIVGFDVLNGSLSLFSDRKLVQFFVSKSIGPKLNVVGDLGYESSVYERNGYQGSANGMFAKIGSTFMLVKESETDLNGFYAGPKLGFASYTQEYTRVPVKGASGTEGFLTLPASRQFSAWLEASVGGRVKLFDTPFLIDVNVQPRYMLYSTKQEEMQPMIVPGFGKSSTKFTVGFAWNLAYQF